MRVYPFSIPGLLAIAAAAALWTGILPAQQTLGGITGEVTDASGGVLPNGNIQRVKLYRHH